MTFLNPLALFALAAAAIPLIVHLFNFRRPRRVDFSSLAFLREVERSSMQRVRVRQWLLLLLRTLAIASLVLAFARPTITSGVATLLSDGRNAAIAIVVDNSPSMLVVERTGERFRRGRDAALRLIEQAEPDDEIYILSTSARGGIATPLRKEQAAEAVAGLDIDPAAVPLSRAVRDAARALQSSSIPAHEIVLFSDFQASMLTDTSDAEVESPASVSLVPLGERIPGNVALTRVAVASRVLDVGQPARLEASVQTSGTAAEPDLVVSAYLDDERVAQAVVEFSDSGSGTAELLVTPRSRGWLSGRVGIEGDGFVADNERYFTLYVPERRRLLLVEGPAASSRNLRLALDPEVSEGRIVFEQETIQSSQLSSRSLGEFDAVVFAGVPTFSSGEIDMIERFVGEGGGVLLWPAEGTDVEGYNNLLRSLGGGRIDARTGAPADGSAVADVAEIDAEHSLFEGVFEGEGEATIERSAVYAAHRYHAAGSSEQTLIRLSNGWPFLQELRFGSGVALFASAALEPSWTELAVRGLFVPLMYRSLFYLSAAEAEMGDGVLLSQSAVLRLPERGESSLRLIAPDGSEIAPEQRRVFGTHRVVINGWEMGNAGIAEVVGRESGEVQQRVAINLDPRESDLAVTPAEEAAEQIEQNTGLPTRTVDLGDDLDEFQRAATVARRGAELWNVLLLLALAFLIAEMLVARRWRPESVPA